MIRQFLSDLGDLPPWRWPLIALLLIVICAVGAVLWVFAGILDVALRICGSDPKEVDEAQRILTSSPSREGPQEPERQ